MKKKTRKELEALSKLIILSCLTIGVSLEFYKNPNIANLALLFLVLFSLTLDNQD